GIGRDYQVSSVAYVRYDRNRLPDNIQMIDDLRKMIENYQLYVTTTLDEKETASSVSFKYTMAYLHYIQGIIYYLGNSERPRSIEELSDQQAIVLKKGDDVKHPKNRLQHIARAIMELGLVKLENSFYFLTPVGLKYYHAFQTNEDYWTLSAPQVDILKAQIREGSSELAKVIQLAIQVSQELKQFTVEQFRHPFMDVMSIGEEWGDVTQINRARFMLNWLHELGYLERTGDLYMFLLEGESPIKMIIHVDQEIEFIKQYILQKGFFFPSSLIENYYLSLKTKPFVILAGISGTGKTKLVKLFAGALGATEENGQFTLIPVRPDWSDPTDLLGYQDLSGTFRTGRLTEVFIEATKPQNRKQIYFVCLDEMNLARVEHYFSDILSIMETEKRNQDQIISDVVVVNEQVGKVCIPDNVYIVGTVNMDETTHPFSKKVLDRAQTIEFNYINLNAFPHDDIGSLVEMKSKQVANNFLKRDFLTLQEAYSDFAPLIRQTTEKLVQINEVLEEIHSHVGFRVRDSICFYMIYNERFNLMTGEEAFDLQLLQIILPRIQGSSSSVKRTLINLMLLALGQRKSIEELMNDTTELYEPWKRASSEPKAIYPRSARKIAYMLRRIEEDGFTSFWLS
ncbi:MAG TPA: DUF3578 domain-containing protein, partial [Bacillota bacterium]|nr:DUF3578 domain-containing protein [Bacillota bacterium]